MSDRDPREQERQEGWAVPIDRIDAFTAGAAMAVDPGQIEKELAALWQKAAQRAQQSGTQLAVIRACLWNFVVHVRGQEEFLRLKRILDKVSETVPTRIIELWETGGPEDAGAAPWEADEEPVRAYLEANFRTGAGGRREVIAEEITLEARSVERRRLFSLVRSLLLPDLPTAFFLSGGLPERSSASSSGVGSPHGRLLGLLGEVDRIVLDLGRQTPEGLRSLLRLLACLPRGPHPVEIADLEWLRLLPWRQQLACLFDDAPRALRQIEAVEIEHGAGAAAGALLLCGWLMNRLSWQWAEGALPGPPGGLQHAWLRDGAGRRLKLFLREVPAADIQRIVVRADGRDHVAAGVRPQRSDAELLVTALQAGGRDPLMYEAFCALAGLLGESGGEGATS